MLDGYDWPVMGRVHWVGFEADAASGKFEVEIYIDNPDLSMRSGVVGRARILKRENQDVLAIPRDAVLPNGSESTVYVVQDDRAVLRPVALGPDQGVMVVVASGLQPGELLVVRGQRELVDGAKVVVTEEATSADGSNGSDPQEVRSGRSQRHSWREQEGGA